MNAVMSNLSNFTEEEFNPADYGHGEHFVWRDDATWILTCAFIIFTMQSGFGLLESGSVSSKNEANIMVKNAIDVIFGGLSYWAFGYGLSFGVDKYSNPFCGVGHFFLDATDKYVGSLFSNYFFQASFATTATTIVSGAMAERTKLEAYIVFSFLNTFIYCIPCHWIWGKNGWLKQLRVIDIAGTGAVHLVGGTTGLIATLMLKPRHGRFEKGKKFSMGNPTNVLLGMFMLWWGWLGFNCGSSYGITGNKWILASRAAVTTINAAVGGGAMAILLSYVMKKRKFDIGYLVDGILGALVSVTAICAYASLWAGMAIGVIGATISCLGSELMQILKVDDPVGVVPVHFLSAIWGMLSVGLFIKKDPYAQASDRNGLFYGGGAYILGIQTLAVVSIIIWTSVLSIIVFVLIDLTIGLRLPLNEELLGSDIVEHGLHSNISYDKSSRNASKDSDEIHTQKKKPRKFRFVNFVKPKKKRRSKERMNAKHRNVSRIHGNSRRVCESRTSSTPLEITDNFTNSTANEIFIRDDTDSDYQGDAVAAVSFMNLRNGGFIDDDGVRSPNTGVAQPQSCLENCPDKMNDCHVNALDNCTLAIGEVMTKRVSIPKEIWGENHSVNIINYKKDGKEITLIV
ncbi:putative ammonium transporter 2 [Glandiceps talaboti]